MYFYSALNQLFRVLNLIDICNSDLSISRFFPIIFINALLFLINLLDKLVRKVYGLYNRMFVFCVRT